MTYTLDPLAYDYSLPMAGSVEYWVKYFMTFSLSNTVNVGGSKAVVTELTFFIKTHSITLKKVLFSNL